MLEFFSRSFHNVKNGWRDTSKYFFTKHVITRDVRFLIKDGLECECELNTRVFREIHRSGIREYGEGGKREKWRNYWTVSRNLVTRSDPRPSWNSNHSIDIHLAWLQSEMGSQSSEATREISNRFHPNVSFSYYCSFLLLI